MNAALAPTAPLEGGIYAGRILIAGVTYALIVAPKNGGDSNQGPWSDSNDNVPGALSYHDGLANTKAMAEAGSKLARWAQGLRIGGFSDWYLPAVDELEVAYRSLKPTEGDNDPWARSGINLNSVPQGQPYTTDFPKQPDNELFRVGGAEAFEGAAYWTSTQHDSYGSYAWGQYFSDGSQYGWLKGSDSRARAVRRLIIQRSLNHDRR